MQKLTWRLLPAALLLSAIPAIAQIHPNLQGNDLLEALVEDYKPDNVLDYSQARDTMYGIIYNVHDSVTCVYSGHRVYLPPGADPSTAIFLNGSANGINCEHTYPQSMGAETGNAESDMHHLFPTRAAVNTARGNDPFAEIPDNQTAKWYRFDQTVDNIPSANLDEYAEHNTGHFEPRESHKGNTARAIFYFYTMYRAEADVANPVFFESQRETLCQWHYLDPADSLEVARTWLIAGYQDGRANPFVLDCSLAARTYCPDTPGECPLVSEASEPLSADRRQPVLGIVPNPAGDYFTPDAGRPGLVSLIDAFGHLVISPRPWSPGEAIDAGGLPAGLYAVVLEDAAGSVSVGKLVKR